jgi:hypothetical protein
MPHKDAGSWVKQGSTFLGLDGAGYAHFTAQHRVHLLGGLVHGRTEGAVVATGALKPTQVMTTKLAFRARLDPGGTATVRLVT